MVGNPDLGLALAQPPVPSKKLKHSGDEHLRRKGAKPAFISGGKTLREDLKG